jgi:predicted NBD/HSP70 family sugar kinase
MLSVDLKHRPALDPDFLPASLWNRAYRKLVSEAGGGEEIILSLERRDGSRSRYRTRILPHQGEAIALNQRYVERLVKFLLWQRGGFRVNVAGNEGIAAYLRNVYSVNGERSFDYGFMGQTVYGRDFEVESSALADAPDEAETTVSLGRHLDGCRIGFDLGGSDRKCAAVIDGKVVFSEEVTWDPYFQKDPQYHFNGVMDTLRRAAEKLPRVDAIGGSSAGVYVNNEVRVASLFRGVSAEDFESRVRRMFFDLKAEWGGLPFEVANDGEVTALAGSMSLNDGAVLGISMGTSQAGGYVTPQGAITNWLNELAFAPIDYAERAHVDEWSKDGGVGAQYFSQQAVGRLLGPAGIEAPADMGLPNKLVMVQELMARGDDRARSIYETIGVYFGYAIAHYVDFYDIRHLLLLGRVLTGDGGNLILEVGRKVLQDEFPEISERVAMHTPGEEEKRHGQAVAAASLPEIPKS